MFIEIVVYLYSCCLLALYARRFGVRHIAQAGDGAVDTNMCLHV